MDIKEAKAAKNKLIGKRIFASLLDYMVYYTLFFAFLYLFGEESATGGLQLNGIKALPVVIAWFLYFPVCEAIFGRTLWKYFFDIHVVDKNTGDKPDLWAAFKRRILDWLEVLAFFGLIGIIVMYTTEDGRRLGDRIGGCAVQLDNQTS